jgi:hypothetical protein
VRTPGGGVTLIDCSPDEDEELERIDEVIWRVIGVGLILGCAGAGLLLLVLIRALWRAVA